MIPSDWQKITTTNHLQELLVLSDDHPVGIFKHSTTCPRSAYAKEQLIEQYGSASVQIKVYYLDLLAHRDLSNTIATDLNIVHQSPQFIVIKNQRVIYSASHEAISYQKALSRI